MPLDFTHNLSAVPDAINFPVEFEPTKVADKKYVINGDTGEYLGVVGHKFNCASHPDFFTDVQEAMTDHLTFSDWQNAKVNWRTARNGAWAFMDVVLPDVNVTINTDKHQTSLGQRLIALHGIDGSCSNMVFFGAIDFFCTNGQIIGTHDKVKRKNTANFSLDRFIRELSQAKQDFYGEAAKLQKWAETSLVYVDVKALIDKIVGGDRKAEKMFALYRNEVVTRGQNLFSLYSAFTNYATYADERNGFVMRNTEHDTGAITMFKREHEVAGWLESDAFKSLVAA